MTTSVQGTFGSQLMVGGFILNNELTDFEYEPESGGSRLRIGSKAASGRSEHGADARARRRGPLAAGGRLAGRHADHWLRRAGDRRRARLGLDVQQAVAAPHFLAQDGPIELEEGTRVAGTARRCSALGHRSRSAI